MRVCVFIDYQNVYRDARIAFGFENDPHTSGQVDPLLYANLICSKVPPGKEKQPRDLHEARVYSGLPNSRIQSKTHAAYMRQKADWERLQQVTVIDRPLQYLPNEPPRQKGIDVELAVDVVTMAVDGEFDCAVIASTDTDLLPSIEYVVRKGIVQVEVAAWWSENINKQLRVADAHLWCHRLSKKDYERVEDTRDYNLEKRKH